MLPDFLNRYDYVLKHLGLFDYEIKVYMTLLSSGPMNYRVLVQESGVPTGRIYQVLSTLESKGFIEVYPEKTKLFKAAEPKTAFRRRLRQIEDDYLELEHKTREAMRELQIEYSQKHDAIQGIVNEIRVGDNSFASVVRENLLKAEDEALISSGEYITQLHLEELMKVLLSREVRIRAICSHSQAVSNGNNNALPRTLANLGINTRILESVASKYIIVDEKCVLLILDEPEKETCVQIQGRPLCRILRENFSDAWGKATPLNFNHNYTNLNLNSPIRKPFLTEQDLASQN